MTENTKWPEGFMDIGGQTFAVVYKKKKEFVDFTLTEMDNPTGLFEKWKNYCKWRRKNQMDGVVEE